MYAGRLELAQCSAAGPSVQFLTFPFSPILHVSCGTRGTSVCWKTGISAVFSCWAVCTVSYLPFWPHSPHILWDKVYRCMQEDQDKRCDQLLAYLYSLLPSYLVPFSTYPVGQGVQVYAGGSGSVL